MKALTIIQPWVSAICYAGKRFENRGWPPPEWLIGQDLCVHAGKTWSYGDDETVRQMEMQAKRLSYSRELPWLNALWRTQSAIMAVITVAPSVQESDSPWFTGPEGWPITNLRVLPDPVPCRGAQGLWNVPADVEREVRRQLALAGAANG